jgi:hypothetical protein
VIGAGRRDRAGDRGAAQLQQGHRVRATSVV